MKKRNIVFIIIILICFIVGLTIIKIKYDNAKNNEYNSEICEDCEKECSNCDDSITSNDARLIEKTIYVGDSIDIKDFVNDNNAKILLDNTTDLVVINESNIKALKSGFLLISVSTNNMFYELALTIKDKVNTNFRGNVNNNKAGESDNNSTETPNYEYATGCDSVEYYKNNIKDKERDVKREYVQKNILITTEDHQITLFDFINDNSKRKDVLNDIKSEYIFSAPHSVQTYRPIKSYSGVNSSCADVNVNYVKPADSLTGQICEEMAIRTKGVCISRLVYDGTDPNYIAGWGDFSDEKKLESCSASEFLSDVSDVKKIVSGASGTYFRNLIIYLVNEKSARLHIDFHGFADKDSEGNNRGYSFIIGTVQGNTLSNVDLKKRDIIINNLKGEDDKVETSCSLEKKLISVLRKLKCNNENCITTIAEHDSSCAFNKWVYANVDTKYLGGRVTDCVSRVIKDQIKNNKFNLVFSSLQLEIDYTNRLKANKDLKNSDLINNLVDFVEYYK